MRPVPRRAPGRGCASRLRPVRNRRSGARHRFPAVPHVSRMDEMTDVHGAAEQTGRHSRREWLGLPDGGTGENLKLDASSLARI